MLFGIMEFITDDDEAYGIVNRLKDALPSGSYLAMYDGTNVIHKQASDQIVQLWNESGSAPLVLRTPEGIARFFDGWEILEPGIVSCSLWRPEPNPFGPPVEVDAFCGVGRKPGWQLS
jgi:hypothetical protein